MSSDWLSYHPQHHTDSLAWDGTGVRRYCLHLIFRTAWLTVIIYKLTLIKHNWMRYSVLPNATIYMLYATFYGLCFCILHQFETMKFGRACVNLHDNWYLHGCFLHIRPCNFQNFSNTVQEILVKNFAKTFFDTHTFQNRDFSKIDFSAIFRSASPPKWDWIWILS